MMSGNTTCRLDPARYEKALTAVELLDRALVDGDWIPLRVYASSRGRIEIGVAIAKESGKVMVCIADDGCYENEEAALLDDETLDLVYKAAHSSRDLLLAIRSLVERATSIDASDHTHEVAELLNRAITRMLDIAYKWAKLEHMVGKRRPS